MYERTSPERMDFWEVFVVRRHPVRSVEPGSPDPLEFGPGRQFTDITGGMAASPPHPG